MVRQVPNSLYPFESHFFKRNGQRMHYLSEGSGFPVVMVHGNPSWSFYYRDLVSELSSSYRAIAPDHIGCGLSDKPTDRDYPFTLAARVEDFGAFIEHLGVERFDLVVHDWGGMIGMAWAVQNPARIRSLVLLNTAAFHLPADKSLPWQLWLVRNTPLGAVLVRGFNAFARGATRAGVTRKRLSSEIRDAYCAPYDSWHNRLATLRFVQDIPLQPDDPGYDIVSRTSEGLSVFRQHRVFIGWGAQDFVFDDAFLRVWKQQYPHAEVHRFEDCGHYILEDASEELIPMIRAFLDGGGSV